MGELKTRKSQGKTEEAHRKQLGSIYQTLGGLKMEGTGGYPTGQAPLVELVRCLYNTTFPTKITLGAIF